jgi:hypothetical protein
MRAPGQLVWWLGQPSLGGAALPSGRGLPRHLSRRRRGDGVLRRPGRAVRGACPRPSPARPRRAAAPRPPVARSREVRAHCARPRGGRGERRALQGANDGPAPWSDPEPELTLSELIAGDPGPEPGQPGPEFPESPGDASMSRGDDAARLALELGGDAALASNDTVPAAVSDAAEALRVSVAETRWRRVGPLVPPAEPPGTTAAPRLPFAQSGSADGRKSCGAQAASGSG